MAPPPPATAAIEVQSVSVMQHITGQQGGIMAMLWAFGAVAGYLFRKATGESRINELEKLVASLNSTIGEMREQHRASEERCDQRISALERMLFDERLGELRQDAQRSASELHTRIDREPRP